MFVILVDYNLLDESRTCDNWCETFLAAFSKFVHSEFYVEVNSS